MSRYSKLAPLSIEQRTQIAIEAANFFSPLNYKQSCEVLGLAAESTTKPFSTSEFVDYLEKSGKLPEALRYQYRIKDLLDSMDHTGILSIMGHTRFVLGAKAFYFLKELTTLENRGVLWLAPALGPEFIINQYKNSIIHITGVTNNNDAHAGSGILLNKNTILTCAHVINDMTIDKVQIVQGTERRVKSFTSHKSIDVGVISLEEGQATPYKSIAFRNPNTPEPIYTLGFPRIPLSRNPALVIQSGEVVSEEIKTITGDEVFLYSAIARPGNSGGPIIASSGHVVGIVTQDLSMKDAADAPFYAGVSTEKIEEALKEIAPEISLPIENYE